MIKHSTRRNERFPTNTETKVYEFEGLSLVSTDIRRRWRYLGRHIVDAAENLKVILTEEFNLFPSKRRPFNFFTKTEWSLAELHAKYPGGVSYHKEDPESPEVPLGAFIVHKKSIWKRDAYRSVSEPKNEDDVSDKILCFFERKDSNLFNTDIQEQSNRVINSIRGTSCLNKHLQGMTIYKNISSKPGDVPYVDLIVEFTVLPGYSYGFKPLLDLYCMQFEEDIGFYYGLYQRHQLINDPGWS